IAKSDSGFSAETDHSPRANFCVQRNCAWRMKISPTEPPKSRVSAYVCSLKKLVQNCPASRWPNVPYAWRMRKLLELVTDSLQSAPKKSPSMYVVTPP